MCYKVSKALAESVKKNIDVIYELTKDGYDGSFNSLGSHSLMKVLSELVKRGVVSKKRIGKYKFHYQWIAGSAPTTQFYVNVAGTLGKHQNELDRKNRANKKAQKEAEKEIVLQADIEPADEHLMPVEEPKEPVKTISDYTLAELWAEMEARGVVIENNHLVVIERTVIA